MDLLRVKEQRPSNDWSFARIGYRNVLAVSSLAAATPVLIPNTWERWTSATGAMQARFQPASASVVNYVALAAHNLFSSGVTSVVIELSKTVNASFFVVAAFRPQSDKPIFIEIPEQTGIVDCRITITGGSNRELGVFYVGKSLIMCRGIFGGHSPITLSSVTEYRNATSDSGQFLGRRIRRQGQQSQFSWSNIPDIWYRQEFQPFVVAAKVNPFFIQWRPDFYSDEIAFGYTVGDITPSNQSGTTRLMSVNFQMRAHDE